jgi:CheY-like chemotaxis protein
VSSPARLKILVAHERMALGQAIGRVLSAQGFAAVTVCDATAAEAAMRAEMFAALVLDVALPGATPCHELIQLAKSGLPAPIPAVVLVASVFRKTSYKRRPTQLYGADDYVEIHRLGDQLPRKLWQLLGGDPAAMPNLRDAEAVLATLEDEGDQRLFEQRGRAQRLSELIVADLILYAGDRVLAANSAAEARELLAPDLQGARQLFRQIHPVPLAPGVDPIGAAFDEMMRMFNLDPGEPQ